MDQRPEGVYVSEQVDANILPPEKPVLSFLIERVNGDQSVTPFGCTEDEARKLMNEIHRILVNHGRSAN